MDGDSSAKTLDAGANSAIRNAEGSDSIHEASHQSIPIPSFLLSLKSLPQLIT